MYLVTGGGGFIGSHIVGALVARGDRVRVLDDFSNGLSANLDEYSGSVEVVRGDVRDREAVGRAMRGVQYVFHLAALGSVDRSIVDPMTSHEVNVTGTLNVLTAAREAGVERLVYSSSSSVYGENPVMPKVESLATLPVSPYATTKLAAENYTRVFYLIYGLATVSLRYFNVFGPRQRPDAAYAAVIPRFMEAAIQNKSLTVHGDGLQTRDFTYVDNVVSANLLALEAPDAAVGRVFNIACGERYSLLDIIGALEEAVGATLPRRHVEARAGDVRNSQADIGAAGEYLGYGVKVGFSEGLARTWRAFLATGTSSASGERGRDGD
ncbi:MAG: NAD-dependent epimerase/dehydratase family protein [Candidatus Binatia bacterium]